MSNVPKLRFKEFSEEWKYKSIGSIGTFFSGGTPTSSNKSYYDGNIPFIGSGRIGSNEVELFITEEALNSSSAKMVEVGDLLYALYGATSGEVAISKINGAINQAILCIRTNENKIFLKTWLEKNKVNILSTYLQGGQGNLSAQIVKSLKLNLPSKQEQEKIASFLTSVDAKIEQLTKKESLLSSYKKGVMQKIFSGEIRFKADDGSEFCEWEEKKLEDISTAHYQGINTTADKLEYFKNGFPILQAKHITNEIIDMEDVRYVDLNTYNSYKQKFQPLVNDLLISNIGTLGKIVLVEEAFNFLIAWNIFKVTLKTNVDSKFIMYSLKKIAQEGYFERMQTGNATKFVNKGDMLSIIFQLPCLEEQTKIANFLSSIDAKIEQVQKQLNSTKEFKKALLQQMFV